MSVLEWLRAVEPEQVLTGDQVFEAIFEASEISNSKRYEDSSSLEIAIRLLDASEKGLIQYGSHEAIEHLAEECGLYPYLEPNELGNIRAAAMEAFAVELDRKVYLHAKQMEVLTLLEAGENVALSAPTSFGKSLIVDAFISERKPSCVVVIVPTIALIDETRRRLEKNFGRDYDVLSKPSDVRKAEQTIFVLTQERFLNREDVGTIDFLFVDEFYKLDPGRKDQRFQTLNVALYRALLTTKQFFLAGPNIAFIDVGPRWSDRLVFLRSEYQTVTVNTVDRTDSGERFDCFLSDLTATADQQSLVYTKSPPSCRKLLQSLLDHEFVAEADIGSSLGNWIRENYHKDWVLAEACEAGIGLHHGKIPRAVSQLFVELFNEGSLPVLICTSTLIEGVNTSAENVFVYDKEISTQPFDHFSFANIRGRVGRMMQHFVGNVYLYYTPPPETELSVDVPVLSDPDNSDDFILMNYDPKELSEFGQERQRLLPLEYDISHQTLRQYGHFGGEALSEAKNLLRKTLEAKPHRLNWRGMPDYKQMQTMAELIRPMLAAKGDKSTRLTVKQMAWAWSQLLKIPRLEGFLTWFQGTFSPDEVQEGIERAFEFLGSCEFNHATAVGALGELLRELDTEAPGDFSFFSHGLETWFRPVWMKELDEVGIPVPLSERLLKLIGKPASYREALERLASLKPETLESLSTIDQKMIGRAVEPLQYLQ